jgi:hypothetical protein
VLKRENIYSVFNHMLQGHHAIFEKWLSDYTPTDEDNGVHLNETYGFEIDRNQHAMVSWRKQELKQTPKDLAVYKVLCYAPMLKFKIACTACFGIMGWLTSQTNLKWSDYEPMLKNLQKSPKPFDDYTLQFSC